MRHDPHDLALQLGLDRDQDWATATADVNDETITISELIDRLGLGEAVEALGWTYTDNGWTK